MTLHIHNLHLTSKPSDQLIHTIETTAANLGVRLRIRVVFRYCGEPGTPGPLHVQISTRSRQPHPTSREKSALEWAARELALHSTSQRIDPTSKVKA